MRPCVYCNNDFDYYAPHAKELINAALEHGEPYEVCPVCGASYDSTRNVLAWARYARKSPFRDVWVFGLKEVAVGLGIVTRDQYERITAEKKPSIYC